MTAYDRSLFWFRRDLRDTDNAGLHYALASSRQVFCAFAFDREILDSLPSPFSVKYKLKRSGENTMINTRVNLKTPSDINLASYKVWSIEGDRRGDVIRCVSGMLWITQKDDMKDYVIEDEQDFWVTKTGAVVIQALESSQFRYSLNELENHLETNILPSLHTPLPHTRKQMR